MKVHEYQAKSILKKYGVACPKGEVAYTPAEARAVAERGLSAAQHPTLPPVYPIVVGLRRYNFPISGYRKNMT